MKLSKTSWISLIIGAIIIAAASLGWTYSQTTDQQTQLNNKLVQAKQQLAQITFDELNDQKDRLSQQTEQVNSQTAAVKTKLSTPIDSIGATNIILEDAKSHNVNIFEIYSPGLSTEKLASTDFGTLIIGLKVSGTIQNIVGLAASLSERFPTSIERTVQIEREPSLEPTSTPIETPTPIPTSTPTPTSTPESTTSPTPVAVPEDDFLADINVTIYNCEGE